MPEGKKRTKTSATKKPITKVISKKKSVLKKRPAKKVVRKVVTKAKPKATKKTAAKTVTVPIDISPVIPQQLPTPVQVTPIGQVKPKRSKHSVHNWPLHHHLFGIFAVTLAAFIALETIYQYTEATLITIAAYDGFTSALMKPVNPVAQIFTTDAGELTMTYPETWTMTNTTTNDIQLQYSKDTTATVDLTINKNDTDNIFTWLTNNQPSYIDSKVIQPTNGVKALGGILVTAKTTDGQAVQAVYFPIQTNLANKFVVSVLLTYPADSQWSDHITQDYQSIVNQLRFE